MNIEKLYRVLCQKDERLVLIKMFKKANETDHMKIMTFQNGGNFSLIFLNEIVQIITHFIESHKMYAIELTAILNQLYTITEHEK